MLFFPLTQQGPHLFLLSSNPKVFLFYFTLRSSIVLFCRICFLICFSTTGPKPGAPRNLTVTEIPNGFLITWTPPLERANLVQYYTIKYKTDGPWKNLSKGHIRPEDTSYLGNSNNLENMMMHP